MTEEPSTALYRASVSEPLFSPSFFSSPIATLTSSVDEDSVIISVHDLQDAYHTLLSRLQAVEPLLIVNEQSYPSLNAWSSMAGTLARCFQRDIKRNIVDRLKPHGESFASILHPEPSELPEERLFVAQDEALVAQLATKLASTVLKTPAVSRYFSDTSLHNLLSGILEVAQPSCGDGEKNVALATSVLSSLQLPIAPIIYAQGEIVKWLADAASSSTLTSGHLDVFVHLWVTYPSTFLSHSSDILAGVLTALISTEEATRNAAASALSAFTFAILFTDTSDRDILSAASLGVRQFLARQLPSGELPSLVTAALQEDASKTTIPSRWATMIACSIILISGPDLFQGSRSCKFIIHIAERLVKSNTRLGSELTTCLWRCLIWAWTRIPRISDQTTKRRTAGLGILRQELRYSIGAHLVATLLLLSSDVPASSMSTPTVSELSSALVVLKDMSTHLSKTVYQHVPLILTQLVSVIGGSSPATSSNGASRTWSLSSLPVKVLFNRETLTADAITFTSNIRAENRFDAITAISPLPEECIQQHWTEILDIWKACAFRELARPDFVALQGSLVQVWQALLLVQTHLTQERRHLTSTPHFSDVAVSTVAAFFSWTPSNSVHSVPETDTHARVLTLCSQLWDTMRYVFSEAWLAVAADSLLTQFLLHDFRLNDEDIKTIWGSFCASLVATSSTDLISQLVLEDGAKREEVIRQQLWSLKARGLASSTDSQPTWEMYVDFLASPMQDWLMSDEDTTAWNVLLDRVLSHAESRREPSLTTLDALMERSSSRTSTASLFGSSSTLLRLLPRATLSNELAKPSPFLRAVNTALCDLYAGGTVSVPEATQVFGNIRCILQASSPSAAYLLLTSMVEGLSTWIRDEHGLLLEQEHNEIVTTLYYDALIALRDIPMSEDTLHALAPFLCSVFVRIPEQALGPEAFFHFWEHIQPSVAHFAGAYPDEVKTVLKAYHDANGPSGTSTSATSQGPADLSPPTISVIPTTALPPSAQRPDAASRPSRPPPTISAPTYSPPSYTPAQRPEDHLSGLRTSPTSTVGISSDAARKRRDTATSASVSASTRSMAGPPRASRSSAHRVAHERPHTTPERPLKRTKLTSGSPALSSPRSGRGRGASRGRSPTGARWLFDGVEIPARSRGGSRTPSASTASTPRPRAEGRRSAGLRTSPEAPSLGVVTRTHARAFVPPSDDYDAWEVPMHPSEDEDPDHDEGEEE
ncbi:uncharacterized protein BXZ73DRAFT_46475, partial [Epithele typhae]|uniref:uncharacterized protein n=1 Tax=Epithele typhae TaxID=378194 RepID=UPI0020083E70